MPDDSQNNLQDDAPSSAPKRRRFRRVVLLLLFAGRGLGKASGLACGLLRLATTALSWLRSVRLNWIFVRSCIPQTRIRERFRESPSESKCQIWTTSSIPVFPTGG